MGAKTTGCYMFGIDQQYTNLILRCILLQLNYMCSLKILIQQHTV